MDNNSNFSNGNQHLLTVLPDGAFALETRCVLQWTRTRVRCQALAAVANPSFAEITDRSLPQNNLHTNRQLFPFCNPITRHYCQFCQSTGEFSIWYVCR